MDVRFISATNRDPQEAVDRACCARTCSTGSAWCPIKLPPLRERPEDIPLLANHFLTHYWQRHRRWGTGCRS